MLGGIRITCHNMRACQHSRKASKFESDLCIFCFVPFCVVVQVKKRKQRNTVTTGSPSGCAELSEPIPHLAGVECVCLSVSARAVLCCAFRTWLECARAPANAITLVCPKMPLCVVILTCINMFYTSLVSNGFPMFLYITCFPTNFQCILYITCFPSNFKCFYTLRFPMNFQCFLTSPVLPKNFQCFYTSLVSQ